MRPGEVFESKVTERLLRAYAAGMLSGLIMPTALPSSFSGSAAGWLSFVGKANFNLPTGLPKPLEPKLSLAPFSSFSSSSFRFFRIICCCSLSGRLRGLVILPVGGRRGFGYRCFGGRSSSSTRGSSLFSCSLARNHS